MPARARQHGQVAEDIAAHFLQQQGLRILERNFRKPFGEIDIIASEQETLVFAEVRKRSHQRFADGAESINYHKRQKLRRAAQAYLQQHRWRGPVRFDVLVLNAIDEIEWLQDAIHYEEY